MHCFIAISLKQYCINEINVLEYCDFEKLDVFTPNGMSVECLYFLCFVHSYFVSIGINITKMKSKFIFSDRDIVTDVIYMNSPFDQNYNFFLFYRKGLNMFYLITVPGMHL